MGIRNSTVTVNSNRYDASTGQIINAFKSANKKSSQVIDGFVSRPLKSAGQSIKQSAGSKRQQIKSTQVHKRTEKTHTLMRGGLKHPSKVQHSHFYRNSVKPKISTQIRAKTVPKHTKVEHFGAPGRKPADSIPKTVSGELVYRSNTSTEGARPKAAAPLPSMTASVSHKRLERLLDEALTKADSHKHAMRYQAARHFWQKPWFAGSKRWIFTVTFVVVIASILLVAWHKFPTLSIKAAGMRANVNAAIPSYKPDGFTLTGPASADSGIVSISYKSSSEPSQTYKISEAASSMNSNMVAQNVVPKGEPVQTSQVAGNTVYIFGASNDAAWVNNGVLYTIKNQADLSSDQLINIVQGLNP